MVRARESITSSNLSRGDGARRWSGAWLALAALGVLTACGATDDLVGLNHLDDGLAGRGGGGSGGAPNLGGAAEDAGAAGAAIERNYPNLFVELLGKTEAEITAKLDADFEQLFYGDPDSEAIYVEVGETQAYVWDPRAMEVRADGFANALLVAVELDRRTEFDKLWRFADEHIVPRTGPLRGYVRLHCRLDGSTCEDAVAGEPQFAATTALWLADGRWGSSGAIDYGSEAARLMEATFRLGAGEQTALGELTGLVDPTVELPRAAPYAADSTTSAAMLPAYFALWAEKSGDARAQVIAENARMFWQRIADPSTGLVPDVLSLEGVAAPGDDAFSTGCYPVPLAIALDAVWFGGSRWHAEQADRLLGFFREPLAAHSYAVSYTLSGVPGAKLSDTLSLEAPLCAAALPATVDYRREFVQAVWSSELNTGGSRKFGNLLYMMSSLLLSGRFRVY